MFLRDGVENGSKVVTNGQRRVTSACLSLLLFLSTAFVSPLVAHSNLFLFCFAFFHRTTLWGKHWRWHCRVLDVFDGDGLWWTDDTAGSI